LKPTSTKTFFFLSLHLASCRHCYLSNPVKLSPLLHVIQKNPSQQYELGWWGFLPAGA